MEIPSALKKTALFKWISVSVRALKTVMTMRGKDALPPLVTTETMNMSDQ